MYLLGESQLFARVEKILASVCDLKWPTNLLLTFIPIQQYLSVKKSSELGNKWRAKRKLQNITK